MLKEPSQSTRLTKTVLRRLNAIQRDVASFNLPTPSYSDIVAMALDHTDHHALVEALASQKMKSRLETVKKRRTARRRNTDV